MKALKPRITSTYETRSVPKLITLPCIQDRIKLFPTTRYYGSKKKLLPWIFENVKGLKYNTVLDVFGGTASVSLLFKALNKDVTYSDGFKFNTQIASAVLADKTVLSEDDFVYFLKDVRPRNGFIAKNFSGMYYTDEENKWLDGVCTKLYAGDFSIAEQAVVQYALYQSCLKKRPFNLFHRANLNLRLNKDVNREFGNLTTWERPFSELMVKSFKELEKGCWKSEGKIKVRQPSIKFPAATGYDLIYIDPPYVSNEAKVNREHYWRRYHFLEGLAQYKDWPKLIDRTDMLRAIATPPHFTVWNDKSTFKEKLFRLIKRHQKSTVVLSYVSGAYPHENDIAAFFEEIFNSVTIHSNKYSHALSHNRKRELLFIGRP